MEQKRSGTFKVKQMIGGKGYYAEIFVEVVVAPTQDVVQLRFSMDFDDCWASALRFGAFLFAEHYWRSYRNDVTVTVRGWNWLPGDTDTMLSAYVIYNAICLSLDFKNEKFVFDSYRKQYAILI